MAESVGPFDYLEEEIDISGDLIPCEFCGDLFPISVLIEHSSGCQPYLFSGIGEPDPIPEAAREPVVTPATIQIEWDEKVLSPPTANYGSTIKIEQLVRTDKYDIIPKEGGGSVMKKLSSIGNEKMTNMGNEKMTNMGNEKMMNSDTSNSYIHFKTDTHEQVESDSDEDDVPSAVGLQQAGVFSSERESSTQGLDKDFVQLSDDDNEENETVESFLQRANLELYKIKQSQERSRAKWKQAQYASYDSEEEAYQFYHHEAGNIYYQDCY